MIGMWVGFGVLMTLLLAIDLFVLNRGSHVIGPKKAIAQWLLWVVVALACNALIFYLYDRHVLPHQLLQGPLPDNPLLPATGKQAASMFLGAYLVEQMLSMDNMLVIALLMSYFQVPAAHQHRVLFWGIIGAVVLRGGLILAGTALVSKFSWLLFVFGGILVLTAVRLLFEGEKEDEDLSQNMIVRLSRRLLRVSPEYDGGKFLTRIDGALYFTPMLLALIVIDLADAVFAVDSIPATIAFTQDPFLAFTANVFAVLGLRALYFAIAALIHKFVYLKFCLVVLLGFIGMKMLVHRLVHIPETLSLGIVVAVLATGVAASTLFPRKRSVEGEAKSAPTE